MRVQTGPIDRLQMVPARVRVPARVPARVLALTPAREPQPAPVLRPGQTMFGPVLLVPAPAPVPALAQTDPIYQPSLSAQLVHQLQRHRQRVVAPRRSF